MSIRLTKPWIDLRELDPEDLPAQLGVFQLADGDENVVYIGYGGGATLFGLRSAISEAVADKASGAVAVRWELTHGYLSRWEELMMVHQHDFGAPPTANDPNDAPRGSITPTGAGPAPDQT